RPPGEDPLESSPLSTPRYRDVARDQAPPACRALHDRGCAQAIERPAQGGGGRRRARADAPAVGRQGVSRDARTCERLAAGDRALAQVVVPSRLRATGEVREGSGT